MKPVNFAIIEDDPLAQAWLRSVISTRPDWAVSWTASQCATALQALREHAAPQVVLVDLGLPDGSGIDLITQIAGSQPELLIVVVSVFGDEKRVLASIRAGANGYLLKGVGNQDFVEQMTALLEGGSPMSPGIARLLLENIRGGEAREAGVRVANPLDDDIGLFSARQIEIVQLIARGYSYDEIAELMAVSKNTVKTHIKTIYGKLNAHNRSEAVFEAKRYGLIP